MRDIEWMSLDYVYELWQYTVGSKKTGYNFNKE